MRTKLALATLLVVSGVALATWAIPAAAAPAPASVRVAAPNMPSGPVINEGFEGAFPANGWGQWIWGGAYGWYAGAGWAHSGDSSVSALGNGNVEWLVMPEVTAPGGGRLDVSFWDVSGFLSSQGAHNLMVCLSDCGEGGSGWTVLLQAPVSGEWQQHAASWNLAPGETARFAFRFDQMYEFWNIDDVLVTLTVPPELVFGSTSVVEDHCWVTGTGEHNSVVDPGEIVSLAVSLSNVGPGDAAGIWGTIHTTEPGVVVLQETQPFADTPTGASGSSIVPFQIFVGPDVACGRVIPMSLDYSTSTGPPGSVSFGVLVGETGSWTTLLTESFDTATPPDLPASWSYVVTNPLDSPAWATLVQSGTPSVPNAVAFNSGSVQRLGAARLSRDADIDLTGYGAARVRLAMLHESTNPTAMDRVQVVASTDSGATWAPVGGAVSRYLFDVSASEFRQHTVDLSALAGTAFRLGFEGISAHGGDCLLDDIVVEGAPVTCLPCAKCELTGSASAIPTSGYAPLDVAFTSGYTTNNCSSSPDYLWSFGDGATSTAASPNHQYATDGTFTWNLKVTRDGTTATASGTITVDPSADVKVQATALGLVRPGQLFTYHLEATSTGPSVAEALEVSFPLPAGVTLYDIADGGLDCHHSAGTVICWPGIIVPGWVMSANIRAFPPAVDGVVTGTATLTSSTHDPDLTNNSSVVAIQVNAMRPAALALDRHAGPGTASNLNGVLEPGEVVRVEPMWHNPVSTVNFESSTAGGLGGPGGGALYSMPDVAASYGYIPGNATTGCHEGTGNCFALSLAAPTTRPAVHWDASFQETLATGETATWTLHVGGSFADVSVNSVEYPYVETILHNQVTLGCTTTEYCPQTLVSRAQMAVFIARALAGSDAQVPLAGTIPGLGDYLCGSGGSSLFTDVPPGVSYCAHVHYILALGITQGCTATTFCPTSKASRGQMAMFISRAVTGGDANVPSSATVPETGRSYSCEPASPLLHFADIAATAQYCRHTHYIWAHDIENGCAAAPPRYCPTALMERGSMAKFLADGFGLKLYKP